MHPEDFRNVIAPGVLAHHQQSFHVAGLHYHFTPIGGEVVLFLLIAVVVIGAAKWLLGRS